MVPFPFGSNEPCLLKHGGKVLIFHRLYHKFSIPPLYFEV